MTDAEALDPQGLAPWGPREPAPPAPPAPPTPSPMREIVWGVLSTALLVVWLGWQMGWVWGVALVFGVFVHEFGHLMVINAAGLGPSSIRIIPFLGGAATMRRLPASDFMGVLIALAGPAFGLVATIPFFLARQATGDASWLGGAFVIAGLNLLNLAPAPPLDGSKALGPSLARIHPLLERGVLLIVAALAVIWALTHGAWLFGAFVAISIFASLRTANLRPNARPLNWGEWTLSVGLYLAVLAACAAVLALSAAGAGLRTPALFLAHLGGAR